MKQLIAFLLLAIFGAGTAQAVVLYQFETYYSISDFYYSDFLSGNAAIPLEADCITRSNASPCTLGSLMFGNGGRACLTNIANCQTAYTVSDYDIYGRHFNAFGTYLPYMLDHVGTVGTRNDGLLLTVIQLEAVPEPATWALLMIGFLSVGALLRRRQGTAVLVL